MTDLQAQVVKTAPPVAVTGISLVGVPLQEWVYILTIIYLLLQIGVLCVKAWRKRKGD